MKLFKIIILCSFITTLNAAPKKKLQASENKERSGTYTAKTPVKGVNYHIFVPKTYSESNPAGILLHICGTGSSADNSNFTYSKPFLEKHNLIGIHMQIMDGRPSVNYQTKIKGLQHAVAQVQADYKIIPGRGIISSFSEGGVLHGKYWNLYKKKKAPDAEWPFMHHHILSGNWIVKPEKTYMSWYICSGNPIRPNGPDNAWTYLRPSFEYLLKTGNPQSYFRVPENKGHGYTKEDARESEIYFHYADLVQAPFLHEGNWTKGFVDIAKKANLKQFDSALKSLKSKGNKELKSKIEKRIDQLLKVAEKLLSEDIVLADFYIPTILKQLQGLPQEKALAKQYSAAKSIEKYKKVLELNKEFSKNFGKFFGAKYKAKDYGRLYPKYVPFMEECIKEAGEKSLLGKMAMSALVYK